MQGILDWLYNTTYAGLVRDSMWGYPIAESAHLIGIVIMFSTILLADLRLVGVARQISAQVLTSGFLLRFTWLGFALVLASGMSLFAAYAPDTITYPVFQFKLGLIAMAGLNMAFFTFRISHGMAQWDRDITPPLASRVSAGLSILLWTMTIFAGRLIAYPEIFESAV